MHKTGCVLLAVAMGVLVGCTAEVAQQADSEEAVDTASQAVVAPQCVDSDGYWPNGEDDQIWPMPGDTSRSLTSEYPTNSTYYDEWFTLNTCKKTWQLSVQGFAGLDVQLSTCAVSSATTQYQCQHTYIEAQFIAAHSFQGPYSDVSETVTAAGQWVYIPGLFGKPGHYTCFAPCVHSDHIQGSEGYYYYVINSRAYTQMLTGIAYLPVRSTVTRE